MASLTSTFRRCGGERGAELIEMAMVMPILLLIVGGIVDFGFMFRSWEVVTNAAREGARVGILPGYSCDSATPADIQSRIDAYMAASGFPDADEYEIEIDNVPVDTAVGTFTACAVVVRMEQDLPSLSIFTQMFGGNLSTVPVAAAAVMRAETQMAPPAP